MSDPTASPVAPLTIGSPLWKFDVNRRVYQRDSEGRASGGPIWREHWVRWQVLGETRVSWIVGPPGAPLNAWMTSKVTKKAFADGACPPGWARSQEQIDREAWVKDNGYKISDMVGRCYDYETLRRVADLIGYTPDDT